MDDVEGGSRLRRLTRRPQGKRDALLTIQPPAGGRHDLGAYVGGLDLQAPAFNTGMPVGATGMSPAPVAVVTGLLAPAHLRLPGAIARGIAAGGVMAYARVALGVHWPTDVVGGLLLGLCWFALSAAAFARSSSPSLR